MRNDKLLRNYEVMAGHGRNPSHVGSGDKRTVVRDQPWQKLMRPYLKKIRSKWWPTSVVSATWEADVGGSCFEASPGNSS
jgi:hypothetical protein